MKNYKNYILIVFILIVCVIIIISSNTFSKNKGPITYERAKVITIKNEVLKPDVVMPNILVGYQDIKIKMLTGEFIDQEFDIRNSMSLLYNVNTKPNMEIIVSVQVKDNKLNNISVSSYKRDNIIFILAILFFLCIVLVGGYNGLKSVIALIFTGVMVIFFMIPMIFRGMNPILSATITVALTTIISLILISGYSKKTLAAMSGTILGVLLSGIIAFISGKLAHLSGLTMQDADNLIYIAQKSKFNLNGLMFAAILIASLGAIMDVGMSIASSIFEINRIQPNFSKKELFRSGMNVGKDIIGTMSNTLILAFAGGSLNMLIFIMFAKMSYNQVMNLDVLSTELIQSLSGSIGIILTVPITASISSILCKSNINLKKFSKLK